MALLDIASPLLRPLGLNSVTDQLGLTDTGTNAMPNMAGVNYQGLRTDASAVMGQQADAQSQERAQTQQAMGGIQQAFQNSEAEARMVADAYRKAGFTNVADQYRQAFKQNAFNMARRGLSTGSADIDQQVRNREAAGAQGRQVEADANQMYGDRLLQSMQQRFGLEQQAYANPFAGNVEQQRLAGISAQTRRLLGVHDAATDAKNAQTNASMAQAQIIQQLLAGGGQAVGTGLAMQGGN